MALDNQVSGRKKFGVWYDAAFVKPEPFDPIDGLTRAVYCQGNKGSKFLARYMPWCDCWFTDLACKNRRHVEIWTDLPASPTSQEVRKRRGGKRSPKLSERDLRTKLVDYGKPVRAKSKT